MKFTISHIVLLLGLVICSYGQENEQEKKEKEPKKNKIDRRPKEIRIGLDLMSLGTSVFIDKRSRYEANFDLDFYDYLFNLDLGYEGFEASSIERNNSISITDGQYFKIGVDKSFSPENIRGSDIFIGLRYSRAYFNDQLSYHIEDELWGSNNFTESEAVTARWLEMTFGMKVGLIKNISIGYIWRLKMARKIKNQGFEPYFIPGFGATARRNNLGFNFYMIYKLPFKRRKGQPSNR